MAACSDDNDSNPVAHKPASIELFTPAIAENTIDLANSTGIELTCTYPDYGFPVLKIYAVEVSLNSDMSNAVKMNQTFNEPKFSIDAAELASTLTNMEVEQKGKLEEDFPMNIPVYLRVVAALNGGGTAVAGSEVYSNIVALKDVFLLFSLPPVNVPEKLYITGSFCGWSWDSDKCFETIPAYDGRDEKNQYDTQWRLVYIDGNGIKFNNAKDWDGGEKGFADITIEGDLAGEIVNGEGNIASSAPKWYLMIINSQVVGRDVTYTVRFDPATIHLMGPVVGNSNWSEDEPDFTFGIAENGEAVSPAFAGDAPGGDSDGVRAYVKIPGFDWWKSEFMVYDGKIAYRGTGGDQNASVDEGGFGYRVAGSVGQKLYLDFAKGTGEIK